MPSTRTNASTLYDRPYAMGRIMRGWAFCVLLGGAPVFGQLAEARRCILPEQRVLQYRAPSEFDGYALDPQGKVTTVETPDERTPELLPLDEALQLALAQANVIRILSGTTANSTGLTPYDPAITNTLVDQARAAFDPNLVLENSYSRNENPTAILDPGAPSGASIDATDVDRYRMGMSLAQRKTNGGTVSLGVTTQPNQVAVPGLPLNPQTPTSVELGWTKPLLRGRGHLVNVAPIVIARLDTERSFYQLKDGVQEMVRSVIDGYWGLVFARTDVWARRQQVNQLEYAYRYFRSRKAVGLADLGDTAQAEVSLATFRANLIAAEADLLNREVAFLNVLGWSPDCPVRLIPTTPPLTDKCDLPWEDLLAQAEVHRPDLIERKIQLEADRQRLLVAGNDVLPQLDAVTSYRQNALGGRAPAGNIIRNEPLQFSDVSVGLNLALPVGRRGTRAALRQQQLALARDQALLEQQLHAAKHDIAQRLRNLDTFYSQYEAFKDVRKAARINLDRQSRLVASGGTSTDRPIVLNLLQAVTDWGNAISSEALALTRYNAEIAALERSVGVILEDHGILFYEEAFLSQGPGRRRNRAAYPQSTAPTENTPQYPIGDTPAEEAFDLQPPLVP